MRRRSFLAGAAGSAIPLSADVPTHLWSGYDFGPGPRAAGRLNQGPFGIEQDEGWYTILTTTPSIARLPNPGLGMVGYTWEENGPSLAARAGRETLERHVEKLASLPFVDVLYIRCDWRNVQSKPGSLQLDPVWALTLDAAKREGLRVAFRVQLSSPEIQPAHLSMPDFVREQVPVVRIGRYGTNGPDLYEPRYDHPRFQAAFGELVDLLAREFDGRPEIEFIDLMQYGFWGEGHTSNLPGPFPDYRTAEATCAWMTQRQLEAFRATPLAVNTQPDISHVGNRQVIDMAVRAGCWLRSDSIILDEPEQIEALSNRPPWLAVVMEDGYHRHYDLNSSKLKRDTAGVTSIDLCLRHVLDLGGNYWSLWTEAENVLRYRERYPEGFRALEQRMGYRVRPSWIWQRKRYGSDELVIAFANDGVAGVPGILRIDVTSEDGKLLAGGCLDAGHPHGGRLRQASFPLPSGNAGKTVSLKASLELRPGVGRPVRWGCEQPLQPDGSLAVPLMTHDAPGWRKGV